MMEAACALLTGLVLMVSLFAPLAALALLVVVFVKVLKEW